MPSLEWVYQRHWKSRRSVQSHEYQIKRSWETKIYFSQENQIRIKRVADFQTKNWWKIKRYRPKSSPKTSKQSIWALSFSSSKLSLSFCSYYKQEYRSTAEESWKERKLLQKTLQPSQIADIKESREGRGKRQSPIFPTFPQRQIEKDGEFSQRKT